MLGKRWSTALVAAALLTLQAATARATIVLQMGNNPQPDEANVLFTNGAFGTTVTGTTNTVPPVSVDISSTQNLYQQGSGQASIMATSTPGDPTTQIAFDNFSLALTSGQPIGNFLDLIFDSNVNNGQGQPGTGGTATITVIDNTNTPWVFTNQAINNGQNFFTITAINGESIKSVSFDMTSGSFTSLEQIRISGLSGVTVVPEPSTLVMVALAAVGLGGYTWQKRRRTA